MFSVTPTRFSLRRLVVPVCCCGAVGYFVFNAFIGDYGLTALHRLRAEAADLRGELEQKRAKRQEMELRVALMRPESLDPDMLDERARETLNLSHPNDITVMRTAR